MFDLGFFTGTFRKGLRAGFLPASLGMLSVKLENLLNAKC